MARSSHTSRSRRILLCALLLIAGLILGRLWSEERNWNNQESTHSSANQTLSPANPTQTSAVPADVPEIEETQLASLSGRVHWEDTGKGVANVHIRLAAWRFDTEGFYDSGAALAYETATAADGTFAFTGIAPGAYTVARGNVPGGANQGKRERVHVSLSAGETAVGVSCPVARGVRVSGRVIDESGMPVAFAHVVDGEAPDKRCDADGLGRFTLQGYAVDEKAVLYATAPTQSGYKFPGRIPAEGLPDVEIELLDSAWSIEGVVVNERGTPLPGLYVLPSTRTGGDDTDEHGRFELVGHRGSSEPVRMGIRYGRIDVETISGNGPYTFEHHKRWRDVRVVARVLSFEGLQGLERPADDAPLTSGQVVDSEGLPVAGAEVRGYATADRFDAALTSLDGSFSLALGGADTCGLVTIVSGYRREYTGDVPCGSAGNTLRLESVPMLRGRVVDAESGQPLRHFKVGVVSMESDGDSRMSSALRIAGLNMFDDDGEFEWREDLRGPVVVFAEAEGYAPQCVDTRADAEPITVALEKARELRGIVVDEEGRPVPNIRVEAYADFSELSGGKNYTFGKPESFIGGESKSQANGRFLIQNLNAIVYRVGIYPEQYVSQESEVDLTLRKVGEARVLVALPGAIEGVVVHQGQAFEGADIRVAPSEDSLYLGKAHGTAITNEDGAFLVEDLVPGIYRVDCALGDVRDTDSPRFRPITVSVSGGETTTADFGE